jgi:glycosyltransferase involved in cell wall biosynthesis
MRDLTGGGVERQVLTLAGELQGLGLDVSVVVHQARGELCDRLPGQLRIVNLNSSRTLQDIPRLARFLRAEQPDILLSNLDHNNVAAMLAAKLAMVRTKVVICQHNALSSGFSGDLSWTYRFIPLAYRALSPFMGAAVAVSEGLATELHDLAGLPASKIHLIHNAVIGPEFEARAQDPVAHPWLDERTEPVFVTAGRLVPAKDHGTLLRALAVHRRSHSGRLLVLGAGTLQDGLQTLSRDLGIADAVDFLGFQPNPLPYFRRADAFVLSSVSEGFGNVLVEAMGCGTPVISTDCAHGPAEILDRGRFGLLVRTGSPDALAGALGQVGDLRDRWPAALLKARAADFSNSACASDYLTVFRALIRTDGQARRATNAI